MKHARIVGLGIALMLSVGVAGPATAKTTKVESEVDHDGYGYPDDASYSFVGNVYSKKSKCERRRRVTVYYVTPSGKQVVGSDKTDRTGDWEVSILLIGDAPYYAKVKRKTIKRGDNRLVCKGDRSERFGAPPAS